MSWVRIDDKTWCHDKFADLSGNAVRLWMFALCWCNQHEKDGEVPKSMLRKFSASNKDASELVVAGLWEPTEKGWLFHDYLKYQPSKAQLDAQRTQTRERVSAHRERSRNGVTQAHVTPPVTQVYNCPDPNPIPTRTDQPDSLDAKDLTGIQASVPPADDWDGRPEKTPVPLNLLERAEKAGVVRKLAEGLHQPEAVIRDAFREFVGYWSIGGGMGQCHGLWMKKAREHIRRSAERNQLKPIGAIQHDAQTGGPRKIDPRIAKELEADKRAAALSRGEVEL